MTAKIESFKVTGATPRFALEHPPVPGSAICSVNGTYLAESAHVIEGDRLIITDPVDISPDWLTCLLSWQSG